MTRIAEIRTTVARPSTIANAVRPDNTSDMETCVADNAVVTTIERETTGGLKSTVDDYLVNLDVAARISDRYHTDTDTDTQS